MPFPVQERTPPRWRRIVSGWLERSKRLLLGPARTITLKAGLIDFKDPLILSNLALPKAEFSGTNGVRVWFVNDSELKALRGRVAKTPGAVVIANPGVMTADGMRSEVSITRQISINGTNQTVGLVLRFLPHARRGSTDLTSILVFTEAVTNRTEAVADMRQTNDISIRTNVAIAARFQIRTGKSIFLLNTDRSVTNGKTTGVIISSTVQQPSR